MTLELLKEGDSRLQEASSNWDFEADGDPTELVKDMVRLMTEQGGLGLAAPQCGVQKRIFIMGNFTKLKVCINPRIVMMGTEVESGLEGCLSFPDLWLKVPRTTNVSVAYQTTSGETIEEFLSGMQARVFLHEFDHLVGLTFVERVGDLSLKMAKERRTKDLKKKARASA